MYCSPSPIPISSSDVIQHKNEKVQVVQMQISLPKTQYRKARFHTIPLPFDSNGGCKFATLDSAMREIQSHCLHHYGKFTKHLAEQYLPFVSIYDGELDCFLQASVISKKDFLSSFKKVTKKSK